MRPTELEPVEVVDAELVEDDDEAPVGGAVEGYDPVVAILAALETKAAEDLHEARPQKTKTGYARDWELWGEFHAWLAEQSGTLLPLSAITVGTYVAFVKWLDEVKGAAPNSIERRVTGVASEARRHGYEVPKAARAAATQALKPLKLDKERQKRGRGKAAAITPADLRKMNTAPWSALRSPGPVAAASTSCRIWPACGTVPCTRCGSPSRAATRR